MRGIGTVAKKIRGNNISIIFQDPLAALNPVFKIKDQFYEVNLNNKKISRKDSFIKTCEALEKAIKNYWSDDTQELLADQSTFYNKYYSWEKRMIEWEDLFKHAKQRKST